MKEGLVEYIEVAPGMIRIKPSIEGIITQDGYIKRARNILENGIALDVDEKLKYENSTDFNDSVLLYNELKGVNRKEIQEVVFSMYGTDYMVNLKNIDTIIKPDIERIHGTNEEAVKAALLESNER